MQLLRLRLRNRTGLVCWRAKPYLRIWRHSWGQVNAYRMVLDHQDADDVVPSIAAIRLCLRSDFTSFKEALLPRLFSLLDANEGGFEQFLLLMTLQDIGLVSEEEG